MAKVRHTNRVGLHIRVVLQRAAVVGPGRADLLQGVADHGSISAAGRALGMSYRRAWLLIEETAQAFGAPVVNAAPGGPQGGGATLTPLGARVLELYRAIEAKAAAATVAEFHALSELVLQSKEEVLAP